MQTQQTETHSGATNDKVRIMRLDVLRGLAALAVVLFHYTARFPALVEGGTSPFTVPLGFYGVHLFFMVSGFVILMSLEARQGDGFIRSRFIRLYPIFWVSVLLTAAVLTLDPLLGIRPGLFQLAVNLTMLEDFVKVEAIDGVYWSLTYELGFYALMFAIYRLGFARHVHWLPVWMLAGAVIYEVASPWIPHPVHILVGVNGFSHLFACGMAIFLLRTRGPSLPLMMVIALTPLIQLMQDGAAGGLIMAACVAAMLWGTDPRGGLWPIARPMLWLGGVSYAFYLTHQMIGYVALAHLQALGVPPLAALVLVLAGALALAGVLTHQVDQPVTRWLKKVWPASGQATAPARSTARPLDSAM